MRSRKQKKVRRKIQAWMLVFAMLAGLLSMPAQGVKAAEQSYNLSVEEGYSSSSVIMTSDDYGTNGDVRFSIPSVVVDKTAIAKYKSCLFNVEVTVTDFTAGGGEQAPAALLYSMVNNWTWNQSEGQELSKGTKISLSMDLSSLKWGNGSGSEVDALGLRFANCKKGSTVSYSIDSAKIVTGESAASGSGTTGDSTTGGGSSTGETTDRVTSAKVIATISKLSGNSEWSEYNYTLTNQEDSSISGIKIKIPYSGQVSSLQSWNCSAKQESGYIVVSHTAVMKAGATYTCNSDTKFGFSGGATLGTPVVEFVYGEDGGGETSSSELKYPLTGQKKEIAANETPFGKHGELHLKQVDGYDAPVIVDQDGNPFQLRGASTHGMHWNEMTPYVNKDSFQSLRDEWGVNMVRLVNYVTQGGYTEGSQALLDSTIEKGVQAATDLGMYVIIDWHIHAESPWPTESQAETFFTKYAAKYKDYKNVIFEICNEPTGVEWYNGSGSDLYTYAKTIAGIIRDQGSKSLIICGTNTWSQDVDDVVKKPLKDDGFKDILYTFHFYSGSHYVDKMNKVKTATKAGTPIFVTEFGICDASGNGGFDTANADAWIALCDQLNISYACWSLCNKNESASYLKPECSKTTGGWVESDLATTGIWLVNTYRAHQAKESGTEEGGSGEGGQSGKDDPEPTPSKTEQTAPKNVTLTKASRTNNTITVQTSKAAPEGKAYEYSIDGGKTWQTDATFTKLTAGTKYTVAIRYAETEECKASDAANSTVTISTLATNPYQIDISRLTAQDAETYVDTLKTVDKAGKETATVSYDSTTNELTLLQGASGNGQIYNVTGDNAKVTIVKAEDASDVTLILSDVSCKAVTADKVTTNDDSTKSQDEIVVSGAIKAKEIICESGIVKAGSLEGGKITILGDDVTAGKIVSDDTITFTKGTITVTNDVEGNAIEITDANVTVGGSIISKTDITIAGKKVVVDGKIKADGNITISGGEVIVKQGIQAGDSFTMEAGSLDVTAAENQAAIYAQKQITLNGGAITTHPSDDKVAFETSEDGTIILGAAQITDLSKDMFSKTPCDADGKEINFDNIKTIYYIVEDVEESVQVTTSTIELKPVPAKPGYKGEGWVTEADELITAGESIDVVDQMKLTAKYSPILVTAISISVDKLQLKPGDQVQAVANITPKDALNKDLTWSVSDTKVATIDQTGVVTAIADGEVTVTATAKDESAVTATQVLTVVTPKDDNNSEDKDDKDDDGSTGNNDTGSGGNDDNGSAGQGNSGNDSNNGEGSSSQQNSSQQSGAQQGSSTNTTDTNGKDNNSNNQTVGNGQNAGGSQATDADETTADDMEQSFELYGTVKSASKIKISKTWKLAPKKTMKLLAISDDEQIDANQLTYKTSNAKIATVSATGKITAGKKKGKATITVTNGAGITKTFVVQVMPKAIKKLKIKGASATLKCKKSKKLSVVITPGKKSASNQVVWSSSNDKVATVSPKGVVKALRKGKVKITVAAMDGSGKKASVTIKVK